jgi:hypothetical protein
MANKVFISHAYKDREAAKELVNKLTTKGVQPWLDEYELKPGDSWEQQIKDALVESDTVVVLLGEGEPSPNVLVEAGMAFEQGKRIVPVVLGKNINVDVFSRLQQFNVAGFNGMDIAADQIAHLVSG